MLNLNDIFLTSGFITALMSNVKQNQYVSKEIYMMMMMQKDKK